jgi:hypothetical protein
MTRTKQWKHENNLFMYYQVEVLEVFCMRCSETYVAWYIMAGPHLAQLIMATIRYMVPPKDIARVLFLYR